MKKIIIALLLFACNRGFAQNCKPDVKTTDKFTKETIVAWQCDLYDNTFAEALTSTGTWNSTIKFDRSGETNHLTVYLVKNESSAQNATFESPYKGENGKEILFGFTSGSPLKFKVTDASTISQMNNMAGALFTTITLSITLTTEDMDQMRKAFSSGKLNAVRLNLANNMTIEKDIKEKKAIKINEKVSCFLAYP